MYNLYTKKQRNINNVVKDDKMKKQRKIMRFVGSLLLFVCLISIWVVTTQAEEREMVEGRTAYSQGLEFISNGDGTCDVSGIGSCTDAHVNIPPVSPTGDRVTRIREHAFTYRNSIQYVTIPSSVASIGCYAFFSCEKLQIVTIPSSVTDIGENAFFECTQLKCAYLPNTIDRIPEALFGNCTSLMDVHLPESVRYIGNYAFGNCTSLRTIYLPDTITDMEESCFTNCIILESINLPKALEKIGDYVFDQCTLLNDIEIPNSVTYIGNRAFAHCYSLNDIEIPNSVTYIGNEAFAYCHNLAGDIFLPEGLTTIGEMVFYDCGEIENVVYSGTTKQWETIEKGQNYNVIFLGDNPCYKGHTLGSEATCTKDQICTTCGAIITKATGHTPGEWIIVKEPDIGIDGEMRTECTVCHAVLETEILPGYVDVEEEESESLNEAVSDSEAISETQGESLAELEPGCEAMLLNMNLVFIPLLLLMCSVVLTKKKDE